MAQNDFCLVGEKPTFTAEAPNVIGNVADQEEPDEDEGLHTSIVQTRRMKKTKAAMTARTEEIKKSLEAVYLGNSKVGTEEGTE